MPNIGLLEGFAPSRMRTRPSVIVLGNTGLVRAPVNLSLRSQPNYLRGDSGPAGLSTTASISAGAAAAQEQLYKQGYNAAIAAGKSESAAKAAGAYAIHTQGASIVADANARIAAAKTEIASRPAAPTVTRQTLIDDYQGVHPGGSRGGSGSVVGPNTYRVEPDKPEEPTMPIDTRGNSTGAYATDPATTTGASAGSSGGMMLPLLAVAAYFMFK